MKHKKQKLNNYSKLLFVVLVIFVLLLRVTTFYAVVSNKGPAQNKQDQTYSSTQTKQSFFHISYQLGCGLSCSTAYGIEIDDDGSYIMHKGDPSKPATLKESKGQFSAAELLKLRQIVNTLVEIGGESSPVACCDIPSTSLNITQDLRVVSYQYGLISSLTSKSAAEIDKLEKLISTK